MILSLCQIGFRRGCSVRCAHVDLEGRIQLAHYHKQYAALVSLEITKAYDCVGHANLINSLHTAGLGHYFIAWVNAFF